MMTKDELFWIKISSCQQPHPSATHTSQVYQMENVTSGTAVIRSMDQLRQFDKNVRREMFESSCCSGAIDTIHEVPPPLPSSDPNAKSIQDYLEAMVRIPRVVHSSSIVSLLKLNENHENLKKDNGAFMYIQYLLPGVHDEPPLQDIPRVGVYTKIIDNVSNGWWVVWWFRLEHEAFSKSLPSRSKNQVSYKLFLQSNTDPDTESEQADLQQSHELVYEQCCNVSQNEIFHGSYRLPTVGSKYTAYLELTNTDAFFLGTNRVSLECTCVSHHVFTTACEAAQDHIESEHRRTLVPMVASMLDGDASPRVQVHIWKPFNDDAPDDLLLQQHDVLRAELAQFKQEASNAKKKLRSVESERQVWQVAKEEILTEISRLIECSAKEREQKLHVMNQLKMAQSEITEIREKLKECLVDDAAVPRSVPNTVEALVLELQQSKHENEELRRLLEHITVRAANERKQSQDVIDDLRVKERMLQVDVNQLVQELIDREVTTPLSHRTMDLIEKRRRLDLFQHPDSRLNQQLTNLRDRQAKLSVIFRQNPNDQQNLEMIMKIEKIILDIVASGTMTAT